VTPETFVLEYNTPTDRRLQARIEQIDTRLRAKYGMSTEQTAVGVLDFESAAAGDDSSRSDRIRGQRGEGGDSAGVLSTPS
jgi:hypothetical protein